MIDLVCVDVDGTLVGSGGVVADEVWAAAERARAAGIRLAVCSGRPAFGLARGYAERLDGEGWHVFQNGASVVRVATGESRSRSIAPDAVERLVAAAGATGRILELYTDADYAVESTDERAVRHAGLLGVPFRPRPFSSLEGPVVRAQWLLPHADAEAVLAQPDPALHLSHSTSPVMPDTSFINITPHGVEKATAVSALAEAYGISMRRVMMVGDGLNDVGVLRAVGWPVAMQNAEPEVHAVARRVVGHVDRAGLAEALELAMDLRRTEMRESSAA
ncbi:MAG: Cof-like hydrolase [Gemmatimonadetes bacterium]|nr:Cof-like hydrolase [Gemmatimonadota bacterium]